MIASSTNILAGAGLKGFKKEGNGGGGAFS